MPVRVSHELRVIIVRQNNQLALRARDNFANTNMKPEDGSCMYAPSSDRDDKNRQQLGIHNLDLNSGRNTKHHSAWRQFPAVQYGSAD
jgi:hypothetical protein